MTANEIFVTESFNPASAVYPGHPLTLACVILQKYPNWGKQDLSNPSEQAILADFDIPGARGPVKAAMKTIGFARQQSPQEAIKFASEYWAEESANGYKDYFKDGVAQAKSLENYFQTLLTR